MDRVEAAEGMLFGEVAGFVLDGALDDLRSRPGVARPWSDVLEDLRNSE